MMDIEKLIEQANRFGMELKRDGGEFEYSIGEKFLDYATALSTLQAENEKLRNEVERQRRSADDRKHLYENAERAYMKVLAELEQKEKYYEQMVDALAATESADLAQMTACVYYKPGGLCRYGGDDPANVCVLGPCPHERTAEEVLADLARVTAERDAAIEDLHRLVPAWKWGGEKED